MLMFQREKFIDLKAEIEKKLKFKQLDLRYDVSLIVA